MTQGTCIIPYRACGLELVFPCWWCSFAGGGVWGVSPQVQKLPELSCRPLGKGLGGKDTLESNSHCQVWSQTE